MSRSVSRPDLRFYMCKYCLANQNLTKFANYSTLFHRSRAMQGRKLGNQLYTKSHLYRKLWKFSKKQLISQNIPLKSSKHFSLYNEICYALTFGGGVGTRNPVPNYSTKQNILSLRVHTLSSYQWRLQKKSIGNPQYCWSMTLVNSASTAPTICLPLKGAELCHTFC